MSGEGGIDASNATNDQSSESALQESSVAADQGVDAIVEPASTELASAGSSFTPAPSSPQLAEQIDAESVSKLADAVAASTIKADHENEEKRVDESNLTASDSTGPRIVV